MHMLAKEIGLTRSERMDLAEMLLRRDITSWKQLDDVQQCRILDALEGWMLIDVLLSLRPPSGEQVEHGLVAEVPGEVVP